VGKIVIASILIFGAIVITSLVIFLLRPALNKQNGIHRRFSFRIRRHLMNHGWFLQSEDSVYWKKRNEKEGHLTLFTLKGR
jgi:hypothetical protein